MTTSKTTAKQTGTKVAEKMRHSAAHVLAQAVLEMFPEAKLGIGPATEDGFYYDFQIEADLEHDKSVIVELEERMQKIIEAELPFTQVFLSKDEAIDMLHQQGQIFKSELLQAVPEDEVSFYKTGEEFMDLCRGPHVDNTGKIGAIKLTSIEQVHWLGSENRPLMYRISGVAFNNTKELEEFVAFQASLRTRDHMQIAQKQALITTQAETKSYTIEEQGIGLKNMLYQTIERALATSGAQRIEINQFKLIKDFTASDYERYYYDRDCIKLSDDLLFVASPIAEAAGFLLTELEHDKNQGDYPLGRCFTYLKHLDLDEIKSNPDEANGLFNTIEVNKLVLSQLGVADNLYRDLREVIKIMLTYYKQLLEDEFYFKLEIGTSESNGNNLLELLSEFNLNIKKTSFTGSGFKLKLFHKDIFKRNWEVGNISSHSELSERLTETTNSSSPLVYLQADLISSVEKLIALVLEHYNGEFPLALAPFQAIIITENEDHADYAKSVYKQLLDQGVRVKINLDNRPLEHKIDMATQLKYPFILTIGEQEAKNNVFSVKPNSDEDLGLMSVSEFLQKLVEVS